MISKVSPWFIVGLILAVVSIPIIIVVFVRLYLRKKQKGLVAVANLAQEAANRVQKITEVKLNTIGDSTTIIKDESKLQLTKEIASDCSEVA